MEKESKLHLAAGIVILASVVLTVLYSKWWLLFAVFAGVNLVQSAFTKECLVDIIMKKCCGKCGCSCGSSTPKDPQ